MTSLSAFPAEILAQILWPLCSRTITRLWLTGNCILKHRLAQGGVQSWRTICKPYDLVVPCMGQSLPFLDHLQDYHIKTTNCVTRMPIGAPKTLPSTLVSLVLISPNVFQFLSESLPGSMGKSHSSLRSELPSLLTLDLRGNGLEDWPILDFPPNLTNLCLSDENSGLKANSIFRKLPDTLVRCKLHVKMLIDDGKTQYSFPLGLKTLSLHKLVAPYNWFCRLPPNLRHLSIGIPYKYHRSWNWRILPPHLNYLKLSDSSSPSFSFFDKYALSQFPRTILTLKLPYAVPNDDLAAQYSDIPESALERPYPPKLQLCQNPKFPQLLPPSLTCAAVGLAAEDLQNYPNLKTFLTSSPISDDIAIPSSITKFTAVDLNSNLLRKLPRTLKSLSIINNMLNKGDQLETFLPSLTRLSICSLDPQLLQHIPSSVTELSLMSSLQPTETEPNQSPIWKDLEKIRKNLKNLTLQDTFPSDPINWNDTPLYLPLFSNLKELTLKLANAECILEGNQVFPDSLELFDLSQISSDIPLSSFKILPKNLISLYITFNVALYPDWDPKEYIHFPRRLRTLSIEGNVEYEPTIEQYLPPAIWCLSYNQKRVKLAPKTPTSKWAQISSNI